MKRSEGLLTEPFLLWLVALHEVLVTWAMMSFYEASGKWQEELNGTGLGIQS